MADRAELTVIDLKTSTNALNGVPFTGVVGIIPDGHKFASTGKEFVVITKSGTSGAVTFQAAKTAGFDDIEDRVVTVETTDAPLIIANLPASTFRQSDGFVYVDYEVGEEAEFTIQVFRNAY